MWKTGKKKNFWAAEAATAARQKIVVCFFEKEKRAINDVDEDDAYVVGWNGAVVVVVSTVVGLVARYTMVRNGTVCDDDDARSRKNVPKSE